MKVFVPNLENKSKILPEKSQCTTSKSFLLNAITFLKIVSAQNIVVLSQQN